MIGRGSDFGFSMDSKGVGVLGKFWDGSWLDGMVICFWFLYSVFKIFIYSLKK